MSTKVYEVVTARIIELLEAGEIPWQRPWSVSGKKPMNLLSQKEYKGINRWNLLLSGYSSPYWLSYKQALELGGNVRKGEKGFPIVFFKVLDKETASGEESSFAMARFSTVFNLAQCEGITLKSLENETPIVKEFTPIESAQKIANGYFGELGRDACPGVCELRHEGDKAFYSVTGDFIQMPKRETFQSPEEYYSVLFHEIVHSTGNEKRLNRPELMKIAGFGTHDYSKEELVAEMGSAFLCHEAGISQPVIKNQAAYIQSWLKKLKNDRSMLVSAASKAEKATSYIMGKGLSHE